jgi:hypothetical protein
MAASFIFPPVHSVIKVIRRLNLAMFVGKSTLVGQRIDDR